MKTIGSKFLLPKILILVICFSGIWVANRISVFEQNRHLSPTALVLLGGGIPREIFTAKQAKYYPDLPIIISSGSPIPCLYEIFVVKHQVNWDRIIVDFKATDTVTNFTALLPYLKAHHHRHVYLIAGDGHMKRAEPLAQLIWGSQGIAYTPMTFPEGHHRPWWKPSFDIFRSVGWILFGDKILAPYYVTESQIQRQTTLDQAYCDRFGMTQLPLSGSSGS